MTSKPSKKKVVVLISGGGSNLQALIGACKDTNYPAEIVAVISNKSDAYGLERAKNNHIQTAVISHKDYPSRAKFDEALHKKTSEYNPDIVCLAGFMRILTAEFVAKWQGKLINIHPSLLPKHKGLGTHARAISAGDSHAGCTVHFVTQDVDAGEIILQNSVEIANNDTAETLAKKVLKIEHKTYPQALKIVAEKN